MKIALFVLITCFGMEGYCQEFRNILLKVTNDKNESVYDAFVIVDDNKPMLTDESGVVTLTVSNVQSVRITIQHLTYEKYDTIMVFPLNVVKLDVKLKNKEILIDEVTVIAAPSITEKQVNYIKDILLNDGHILALIDHRDQFILKIFDSSGIYTGDHYSFTHDGNFNKIIKGHLPSSFYLTGTKMCLPFSIGLNPNLTVTQQQEISLENYSKTVGDVIFYNQNQLIKKDVSKYNNYVKLYLYDTHSLERRLIYEMYDRDNEKNAIYNYNKIKSIYLSSANNSNEKDIDYGFTKINVLEDPNWNGDILDLYVSNDQNPFLNMYQIATQGLKTDVKIRDRDLWMIDNINKKIVTTALKDIKLIPHVSLPESKSPFTFVQSEHLICIENGVEYYYLDESVARWVTLSVDDADVFYPKRKILLGQHLYILGRKDGITSQNTIMKFKVFE